MSGKMKRYLMIGGIVLLTVVGGLAVWRLTSSDSLDTQSEAAGTPSIQSNVVLGSSLSDYCFRANAPEEVCEKYFDTFKANFQIGVTESVGQMWNIRPDQGVYNWQQVDRILEWTEANQKALKFASVIWDKSDKLPGWYSSLPTAEARKTEMLEYVSSVINRYENDIEVYDLINHPLNSGDANNYMLSGLSRVEASVLIFRRANQANSNLTYLVNEGGTVLEDATERERFINYINSVNSQLNEGEKIDGIGLMSHLGECTGEIPDTEELRSALDQYHNQTGLPIYITELDISYDRCGSGSPVVSDPSAEFIDSLGNHWDSWYEYQGWAYGELYELFLTYPTSEAPYVESLITWGFYDGIQWREDATFFFASDDPAVDFTPKPAYNAVKPYLCHSLCSSEGRTCGYGGCGLSCGECLQGELCENYQCVARGANRPLITDVATLSGGGSYASFSTVVRDEDGIGDIEFVGVWFDVEDPHSRSTHQTVHGYLKNEGTVNDPVWKMYGANYLGADNGREALCAGETGTACWNNYRWTVPTAGLGVGDQWICSGGGQTTPSDKQSTVAFDCRDEEYAGVWRVGSVDEWGDGKTMTIWWEVAFYEQVRDSSGDVNMYVHVEDGIEATDEGPSSWHNENEFWTEELTHSIE